MLDVPVGSISEVDTDYWTDGGSEPTVRRVIGHLRMVLDVDPGHPRLLGADGRLMDGMHRVCRAILEGRATIAARRFAADPEPDHRNVRFTDVPY